MELGSILLDNRNLKNKFTENGHEFVNTHFQWENPLIIILSRSSNHDTESESCSVVSDSLQPHALYSLWTSPGQNTGVGSHSPFQGIFPTWGSNPDLPHCRWILYQLSHKGSPRILEWVAYPFSRGSS